MTDQIPADVGRSSGSRALGLGLGGVTLILAFVCAVLLSCTLTQSRISSIAFSGVSINVWKLDDIRRQWQAHRDQIGSASSALAVAQQEKAAAAAKFAEFDLVYRPARTAIDAKMAPLITRLRGLEPDIAKQLEGGSPVERTEVLASQRDTIIAKHPEVTQQLQDVLALGDRYKKIDEERIKLRSESESRSEVADAAERGLAAQQTSLDNLFSAQFGVKPVDPATRARIENAMFELSSGGRFGTLINSILIFPPEILTLMLVIMMGVLGSSLQLTHQHFVENEPKAAGVFLLRLCVGAITALVIFIVAKAGVPIVADASRIGGDAPINPYFVSFLAIISGLMSDKAIASVESLGAKYFDSADKDIPRWARPEMAAAVSKIQKSRGNLAALLNVGESTLDAWILAKEPTPLAGQKLLSAALGQPIRELFSDLPAGENEPRDLNAKPPTPGEVKAAPITN